MLAAALVASPAVHTQPSPSMPADARAQIAPGGRLRAALNYSNFLLVSKRTPEHAGVAPDLARELARRAGATVEFVGYDNAGLVADAARDNAWDVAFIGAEPARADLISFTPAYVEIEATYLVKGDAPFRTVADLDRDGVRIATAARAAYTLFLQRTLTHATIVEVDGIQGSFDAFAGGGYDALAGLTPRLLDDVTKIPGARLVPDASPPCSSRWPYARIAPPAPPISRRSRARSRRAACSRRSSRRTRRAGSRSRSSRWRRARRGRRGRSPSSTIEPWRASSSPAGARTATCSHTWR